ncbi:LysR family transcriptional regulator [Mesobacillus harenae]|uniref:LysR family transcriptional regulator n=1 Tax=Mesobacillus harenae TaxID=2213203 RepID=UPI0015808184|nr:LysR family transcriptional regulator [Mesobacillus harenae]
MEFHQLKTFYYVATHLNFSKAAEQLSLSQPAVSRQIEALERYFGLPLFYRSKKRVELTDGGRKLMTYAVQIISLSNQAEKALVSLKDLESGELTIGCGTTIGDFVLSSLVIEFQKKFPNIKVNLINEKTSYIIEKLNESKIDLAIVGKKFNDSRFTFQTLFQDKIGIYCSIDLKETYSDKNTLDALRNQTFFMREEGSHTRECVESFLSEEDRSLHTFYELGTNEAIKQAILNKHGIGFLSSLVVRTEVKHHLMYKLPIEKECKREFSVISPKGKYISPIVLIFTSFLMKTIKKYTVV